jgi:hypothetical protein
MTSTAVGLNHAIILGAGRPEVQSKSRDRHKILAARKAASSRVG